jgi:hypothetical protein
MGVMGRICCFVQLLKVKDLVRSGLSSRVGDHFIMYELPHKRIVEMKLESSNSLSSLACFSFSLV